MSIYTQIPSRESTLLYRTIASVFKFRLGALTRHNTIGAFNARFASNLSLPLTRFPSPPTCHSCLQDLLDNIY